MLILLSIQGIIQYFASFLKFEQSVRNFSYFLIMVRLVEEKVVIETVEKLIRLCFILTLNILTIILLIMFILIVAIFILPVIIIHLITLIIIILPLVILILNKFHLNYFKYGER